MALKEFRSKRTQFWQYMNLSIDKALRLLGLRSTDELTAGAVDRPCSIKQNINETITFAGTTYDVWKFRGFQPFAEGEFDPGSGLYISTDFFGSVVVNQGPMIIVSDRSLTVSSDIASGFGFEHTPLANDASLIEQAGTNVTDFPLFMALSQDNTGIPVEENVMSVTTIASFDFETEIYLDFDFIVEKGASVTLELL
jgi:hypothetical protein